MFSENKNVMLFQCILTFSATLSLEGLTQTNSIFLIWHDTISASFRKSFFTVNVFLFVPVNLVMPEINLFQSGFLDAWLWREEFKQKPELLTIHQGNILYTQLGFFYQACTLVYSIYIMQSLPPEYCSVQCLDKDFPCLCFLFSNRVKSSHLSY